MKDMIREHISISQTGSNEGIYFKSNEDYVKYMKSQHTAKVSRVDVS